MKQEIDFQERTKFKRESIIFSVLFAVMVLSPLLLWHFMVPWGRILWLIIVGACLYDSFRIEKYKKKYDIQTYREILAFSEGKTLDEIEKAKEAGKRPYQKWILLILSALAGALTSLLTTYSGM